MGGTSGRLTIDLSKVFLGAYHVTSPPHLSQKSYKSAVRPGHGPRDFGSKIGGRRGWLNKCCGWWEGGKRGATCGVGAGVRLEHVLGGRGAAKEHVLGGWGRLGGWVASNDGTWGGWEAWSDGRSYRLRVGGRHATPF